MLSSPSSELTRGNLKLSSSPAINEVDNDNIVKDQPAPAMAMTTAANNGHGASRLRGGCIVRVTPVVLQFQLFMRALGIRLWPLRPRFLLLLLRNGSCNGCNSIESFRVRQLLLMECQSPHSMKRERIVCIARKYIFTMYIPA